MLLKGHRGQEHRPRSRRDWRQTSPAIQGSPGVDLFLPIVQQEILGVLEAATMRT